MMNRTLQYFKNIRFNSLVNKTIANDAKKKYNINNVKNRTKKYQQITIRNFTTGRSAFGNETPEPPFDNRLILAAAIVCGTAFTFKKI
jgi:hypothetical protein